MSPQRSNRSALLEGTLRCLERLPPEQVTARVIAEESGANLASIGYHFGSKDALVTEAVVEGLRRWLTEVVGSLQDSPPAVRLARAADLVDQTRVGHAGLARNFLIAQTRALHDERTRQALTDSYRSAREQIARMLGLGEDQAGQDAAAVLLATFDGLLVRALLHPESAPDAERLRGAAARLSTLDGMP